MGFAIILFSLLIAAGLAYSAVGKTEDRFGKAALSFNRGKMGLAGLVIILGIVFSTTIAKVPGSETGVVTNMGQITNRTLPPGLNFKLPWEGVNIVNTSVLAYQETNANVFTSTSQNALADFTLNYSINPSCAPEVLRKYQNEFQRRIVAPRVQAILKENTVKYTPTLLTQKRGEVQNIVEKQISSTMKGYCVTVSGFLLSNISFGTEYQKKSEGLAAASQELARQKIETNIIIEKASQVEEAAKGQAKANIAIRNSLPKDPNEAEAIVHMRLVDLLDKHWDGTMPLSMGGGSLLSIGDVSKKPDAKK